MRIKIDFDEACKYLFENPYDVPQNRLYDLGIELNAYIIESLFNGADLASIFIGVENDNFIFELMTND